MKRVTAFVGSARTKHTVEAVRRFFDRLQALEAIETELVILSDYQLETCRGCKLCFDKGEEACPLKDDRDLLIGKLEASDGVVFASPSYMFQVSGWMKTFIDRLAFLGHRPRFFGKAFTNIVVQGLPLDAKIGKYLNLVGSCFGFAAVKGSRITVRDPMTQKELRKMDQSLAKQSKRFYDMLQRSGNPVPTLTMLIGFRIGRTTMKLELDDASRDYRYYKEKDWFDADYFYATRLGPLKKAAGKLFDFIAARMATRRVDGALRSESR
ncbi:flavodoxin family protein [Candidatus Bipolaricaulota bacterium]|nr:flavodoxin family protein [Candidatus Bipolaricaulota bacterium]